MNHNQAVRYFRKQAALAGIPFEIANKTKHRKLSFGDREIMISHGSSPVRNPKRLLHLMGIKPPSHKK